jgi:hypothetical protein
MCNINHPSGVFNATKVASNLGAQTSFGVQSPAVSPNIPSSSPSLSTSSNNQAEWTIATAPSLSASTALPSLAEVSFLSSATLSSRAASGHTEASVSCVGTDAGCSGMDGYLSLSSGTSSHLPSPPRIISPPATHTPTLSSSSDTAAGTFAGGSDSQNTNAAPVFSQRIIDFHALLSQTVRDKFNFSIPQLRDLKFMITGPNLDLSTINISDYVQRLVPKSARTLVNFTNLSEEVERYALL